MKVRDLIKILSAFDPDAEVVCSDVYEDGVFPILQVASWTDGRVGLSQAADPDELLEHWRSTERVFADNDQKFPWAEVSILNGKQIIRKIYPGDPKTIEEIEVELHSRAAEPDDAA